MNVISAQELEEKLENGEKLSVIDVREDNEVAEGKIPGAVHIPLGQLSDRLSEIPKNKHHYLICHAGGRSARGCDVLLENGYDITNVSCGMSNWDGKVEK